VQRDRLSERAPLFLEDDATVGSIGNREPIEAGRNDQLVPSGIVTAANWLVRLESAAS
jgi:hypothetical protein